VGSIALTRSDPYIILFSDVLSGWSVIALHKQWISTYSHARIFFESSLAIP
jgi:hypothetical protein